MAKKKLTFTEKMRVLKLAATEPFVERHLNRFSEPTIGSLPDRITAILAFLKRNNLKLSNHMYCFIFYDISDNRIRNYIAKYLLEKGCQRVQKSVYMANLKNEHFKEIFQTLKEVNDMYDNEDSIMFVPVSNLQVEQMKLVGKNIDFSLIVDSPSTIFI